MHSPSIEDPPAEALLRAWSDAFNAADLAALCSLYAEDALLWGTTALSVIDTPTGIGAYFAAVFGQQPAPKVQIDSAVTRRHGDTTVIAGLYRLELVLDGRYATVPARYSFTLRRHGSHWRIVQHHSSMLPAGTAAAAKAFQ